MNNDKISTIDIEKVLRDKAGAKARYVPGFVVQWLKRIVHQDEINDFLHRVGDKQGVPWLDDCIDYLDFKFDVQGAENLPDPTDGRRYTFVSNHPLGGPDGIALGSVLGHQYEGRIKFLVNDLLMNLQGLAPLFIPINKTGAQSRHFPAMVEAGFKSDNHIIMFPAGLCSRKQGGVIQDLTWQKTFITKSVETERDVIPIWFGGRNSDFFYALANLCGRLHLKFNVAMLFLADEMFKNRHKTFTIKIGRPIPWQTFDGSRTPAEWAAHVREVVYQL
ncbi:MAG: glycerol acyltransferase [Bacteroidaceae bacterium]|nr:glycerol acyltransferase [Bacteroidaceae bacterium]